MNISSIKQYRLKDLVRIAFYKAGYAGVLRTMKRRVPATWSRKNGIVKTRLSFSPFYSRCDSRINEITHDSDAIMAGKIVLFEKCFSMDPIRGWLTDPVTLGQWDKRVYFAEAPTRQEGLADVKYVLELNKFNHLVRVALAYYHTHEKKYAQFIIEAIEGYSETVRPYRSVAQRIIMDMGFRIINLIQILLLCKEDDQFQREASPLINGIIYDQVEAMMRFHTAKWFKTGNGANHVTGEMVGLILGQLWLQQCGIANYDKEYKKEYIYLVDVLARTIAPSGAYLEQSGNYSRLVAEFLVIFDLLRECLGHRGFFKAYEEGHYRERLLQYLRDISYDDYVPNFGDNDDARVLTAFRGHGEQVEYFLTGINPSYLSRSYLDGSQWVFNSRDELDIHLFSRVGKFAFFREGSSIHAHNDLLAVIMGVKGHPIFVDKGMLYYNSGEELRKEYSSIAAHNTICFANIELNRLGAGVCYQYPLCEFKTEDIHDSVVFSGVLRYADIEQSRKIVCQGNIIEIEDTISPYSDSELSGTINYLLDQNVEAKIVGTDIILTWGKKDRISVSIHGIDSLELRPSEYSPAYGQCVETTMIRGEFRVNEEKKIKTIIVL